MSIHPEMKGTPVGKLMEAVQKMDVVPVKCQCGADTVINKAYAKYITGPIANCAKCR